MNDSDLESLYGLLLTYAACYGTGKLDTATGTLVRSVRRRLYLARRGLDDDAAA